MQKNITTEELGYDSFFEAGFKQMGFNGNVGRISAEHKGAYDIISEQGEYFAKITGKQFFKSVSREDFPAVGDWVAFTDLGHEQAVIEGVLPRKTIIKRKFGDKNKVGEKTDVQIIGTNIDVAFIVESPGRDFNLNRFERYFSLLANGGVRPVIVLNKIDLVSNEELDSMLEQIRNRFDGVEVVATSTLNSAGLHNLRSQILRNHTYCFLGSSGVGKSSIINSLLGSDKIKTGEISTTASRGKHVTTGRQMYILADGGIVIDNPGIREVGIVDFGGIDTVFDEIETLANNCKFADCTHVQEKGCNVLMSLNSGALDAEKYANYINLRKEKEYLDMSEHEKRDKDHQFGKLRKAYKKEFGSD